MRNLFILRGAPGSGKSTWIKENELDSYTLSTDGLRLMYQSPITTETGELAISQNNDTAVWKLLMELLEKRMKNGELVIIDATHYKAPLINKYKDLVSKYRYRVNVVDFSDVSLEELKERNTKRGFRNVPFDVIDKMYIALQDTREVKKSYSIISPQEALDMINNPLVPYDANKYDKIVVFGDIHGCYAPLKQYFDENPFNEKYNYIFCGDYLDRGIQNKQTLEFLISLKDKDNCIFLEGNHEVWLREYSNKHYDVEQYIKKPEQYKDIFITKILAQLKQKQVELTKIIKSNNKTLQDLVDLLKQQKERNLNVYYRFELVNVPTKQKELQTQNQKYEKQIEKIQRCIYVLQHEEHNTKDYIQDVNTWYEEEFGVSLSLNILNLLEKTYLVTQNKTVNPIKSPEFLNNTYPQIQDVDKAQIRRFCDRLAQMSYIEYNGYKYLITHGGLPCLPTLKTQTKEIIRGVGSYEDHQKIDAQFIQNTDEKTIQIHGHRNVMKEEFVPARTFNLEDKVEFGGYLRILEIIKNGDTNKYKCISIQNSIYKQPEQEPQKEELTDIQILQQMYDSPFVQVKELGDNIVSFNFTRDAFEKGKWNTITCHARGLFVDKTSGNIVAKSFNKFFNYNQEDETKAPALKQNFAYPVMAYKKENGFLGIISKYNGKIHFFTKSTNQGDFVNWFIGALCDNYGLILTPAHQVDNLATYSSIYNRMLQCADEDDIIKYNNVLNDKKQKLIKILEPHIEEGYSYVFECVDPINDPHVIKYNHSKVTLLEIFKNQLKEEHLTYAQLEKKAKELDVPVKELVYTFHNWEQFEDWKNAFRHGKTQWYCTHEGYVLEDQNQFRVKFKSSYYNFWKQMRSIKNIIEKGSTNKKVYKDKMEIQVVKFMEQYTKQQLKEMSIIDIEDKFYEQHKELL